jgi:hypothetical protein
MAIPQERQGELSEPAAGDGVTQCPTHVSRDDPFPGWESYVPQFVHPVKVAAVEALLCIGEPLSVAQLTKLFSGEGEGFRESNIRYHLRHLVKVGLLEVVPSGQSNDGNRMERFFYFPGHGASIGTLSPFSGSSA